MGSSKVTFAVVLAGSTAGFDQSAYKRDVAALLKGVQLSEIALDVAPSTVAAASVRVVATITTTHQAVASAAVSVLEQYARGGAEPSAGAAAGSDQGRGGDQGSNQGRLEASRAGSGSGCTSKPCFPARAVAHAWLSARWTLTTSSRGRSAWKRACAPPSGSTAAMPTLPSTCGTLTP